MSEMVLPGEADVVVIGAGALGASTAFHLAARGGRRVVLIDRFAVASQTSPRAAGLTQQMTGHEVMSRLARRACQKIADFTRETGEPMEFVRSGSGKLARADAHVPHLKDEPSRA